MLTQITRCARVLLLTLLICTGAFAQVLVTADFSTGLAPFSQGPPVHGSSTWDASTGEARFSVTSGTAAARAINATPAGGYTSGTKYTVSFDASSTIATTPTFSPATLRIAPTGVGAVTFQIVQGAFQKMTASTIDTVLTSTLTHYVFNFVALSSQPGGPSFLAELNGATGSDFILLDNVFVTVAVPEISGKSATLPLLLMTGLLLAVFDRKRKGTLLGLSH